MALLRRFYGTAGFGDGMKKRAQGETLLALALPIGAARKKCVHKCAQPAQKPRKPRNYAIFTVHTRQKIRENPSEKQPEQSDILTKSKNLVTLAQRRGFLAIKTADALAQQSDKVIYIIWYNVRKSEEKFVTFVHIQYTKNSI